MTAMAFPASLQRLLALFSLLLAGGSFGATLDLLLPAAVVSTNPPAKFYLQFVWDAPYTNPVVWYRWSNDVAVAYGAVTNPPLIVSNIIPSSFSGITYGFMGGGALVTWKPTNYGQLFTQMSPDLKLWIDSPTNFWVSPPPGPMFLRSRYTNYDNYSKGLVPQK